MSTIQYILTAFAFIALAGVLGVLVAVFAENHRAVWALVPVALLLVLGSFPLFVSANHQKNVNRQETCNAHYGKIVADGQSSMCIDFGGNLVKLP